MKHPPLTSDDPRLTAYALGELPAADSAQVEAALNQNPNLRRMVEEIRGAAQRIETALAAEQDVSPSASLDFDWRASDNLERVMNFRSSVPVEGGAPSPPLSSIGADGAAPSKLNKHESVRHALGGASTGAAVQSTDLPAESLTTQYHFLRGQDRRLLRAPRVYFAAAGLAAATLAVMVPFYRDDHDAKRQALLARQQALTRPETNTVIVELPLSPIVTNAAGAIDSNATRHEAVADKTSRGTAPSGAADADAWATRSGSPWNGSDAEFVSSLARSTSTFSLDADLGGYPALRQDIEQGSLPDREEVCIEELLNYFPYHYPSPAAAVPFAASLEVAESPWAPEHRLVRIGLKSRAIPASERAAANVVFVIEVSEALRADNRIAMLQDSLRKFVGKLRADDHVAVVVYSGGEALTLASGTAQEASPLYSAIERLPSADPVERIHGLKVGYDIARANMAREGVNRVVLCTAGDATFGPASARSLFQMVEESVDAGITLSVLGLGLPGSTHDMFARMAELGNGRHGYVDTPLQAQRFLVDGVSASLATIAQDVSVEVDFNPRQVASYRLIGYEGGAGQSKDSRIEKSDTLAMEADQSVTALYEIVPVKPPVSEEVNSVSAAAGGRLSGSLDPQRSEVDENLLVLRLRYREPNATAAVVRQMDFPLRDTGATFAQASADFRFAAAVARFGMILRNWPSIERRNMKNVLTWAAAASAPSDDPGGYRADFLRVAREAGRMMR